MFKGRGHRPVLVGIAALVAVVSAACSSTASSSSGSSGPSSSASLGAERKATGTPITVGFISPGNSATTDERNETQAAEAAVQYVNNYRNGANGHPIKLVTCETLETSTGATTCANQMIQANVAAVVLGVEGVGNLLEPLLTKAGIPYVITEAGSEAELLSKNSYNLTSSIAGLVGAPALYAQRNHISQVVALVLGLPTLAGAYQAFGPIPFKKVNVGYKTVVVPVGTPDATSYVQTALQDKPQLLLIAGDPGFCQAVLKAQKTLAYTGQTMMIQQCLDAQTPAAAGGSLKGMYSVTFYNTSSPEYKTYLAVLGKYAPAGISTGGAAPDGYSVVVSFADAMTKGGLVSTDTNSVGAAMKAAQDVPLALGGGSAFSCSSSPVPLLAAVCSGDINIASLDATGQIASAESYDVTPLYK